MRSPKKLVHYPWVVVRIECVLCSRRGCYRLARLAARYGPEQSLDGLLADLAHDCPWWRTNPRKYEPRCGARFVDLDRNLPRSDEPANFRTRMPAREDVPKPRTIAPGSPAAVPMLSTWPSRMIVITCDRCGRRDEHKIEVLLVHGDGRLADLLIGLTVDCPRRANTSIYEQCRACFALPE